MDQLTPLHGKVALALAAAFSAALWTGLVEPREDWPQCREQGIADIGVQPGFEGFEVRAEPVCTRVELPAASD